MQMNKFYRILFVVGLAVLITFFSGGLFSAISETVSVTGKGGNGFEKQVMNLESQAEVNEKKSVDIAPISLGDSLTIMAVGDIMFGSNFPDNSDMPPQNGNYLLQPYKKLLEGGDVVFGNVEGVFMDKGGIPKGSGSQVYCFRQPVSMAKYFKEYGFNLLSVANNHAADFGWEGIRSTDSVLTNLGIAFAGSLQNPTAIIKVKGVTIGLAAFAPHRGCVDMNDYDKATMIVRKLKDSCDIVVVSFHGGGEGVSFQHVPRKTEIFYNQNRGNVYEFAHRMIDAGADVILGHGPHVVRAMELYRNKIIAYSLGNFCTYGKFNLKGSNANAPLLKLAIGKNGDFLSGQIISGKQYGEGGPIPDEKEKSAFIQIKYLTQTDFPETKLAFRDGRIFKLD